MEVPFQRDPSGGKICGICWQPWYLHEKELDAVGRNSPLELRDCIRVLSKSLSYHKERLRQAEERLKLQEAESRGRISQAIQMSTERSRRGVFQ